MTILVGETATLKFAEKFASLCQPPLTIFLRGDLGSGKTTFARGFITSLGYRGNVKSPTFSLVETYNLEHARLYHFDLYRLNDSHELEYTGLRDIAGETDVMCLIEWPERGGAELPRADIEICFTYYGESRDVEIQAKSTIGQRIVEKI